MFNLLVTSNNEAWQGQPYTFDLSRSVREYTEDAIKTTLGTFDDDSVAKLKSLPTVFAYEEGVGQDPKFGCITDISYRANRLEVKVEYELIPLPRFLTNEELWSMVSELDIGNWESNRTHWAVKNVDLMRELTRKQITLPARFALQSVPAPTPPRVDVTTHIFDVAFSFPGEYRPYVEAVARETAALMGANACFYDMNYQAQLARPSLDILLQDIYSNRAKLLVVFIGADYQRKVWPNIEWQAIRSVLITARDRNRIMYVRVDAGSVDGVFAQDGYLDASIYSPAQIAAFIAERAHFAPPILPF